MKVAQLETRRRLVAFGELRQVRRNQGAAVEPQLNAWDEDKRADSDSAGEHDDKARVSDGKSQQVSDQKHTATR